MVISSVSRSRVLLACHVTSLVKCLQLRQFFFFYSSFSVTSLFTPSPGIICSYYAFVCADKWTNLLLLSMAVKHTPEGSSHTFENNGVFLTTKNDYFPLPCELQFRQGLYTSCHYRSYDLFLRQTVHNLIKRRYGLDVRALVFVINMLTEQWKSDLRQQKRLCARSHVSVSITVL